MRLPQVRGAQAGGAQAPGLLEEDGLGEDRQLSQIGDAADVVRAEPALAHHVAIVGDLLEGVGHERADHLPLVVVERHGDFAVFG